MYARRDNEPTLNWILSTTCNITFNKIQSANECLVRLSCVLRTIFHNTDDLVDWTDWSP